MCLDLKFGLLTIKTIGIEVTIFYFLDTRIVVVCASIILLIDTYRLLNKKLHCWKSVVQKMRLKKTKKEETDNDLE